MQITAKSKELYRPIPQNLVRNNLQPKLKQAACSELTQISPLEQQNYVQV